MTAQFAAGVESAAAELATAELAVASAGPVRRRFTAAEYHAMGRAGILGENDRVELLNGDLIRMPPIGDWHNGKVARLNCELLPPLLGRAVVLVQGAVRLDDYSEPQPDLALLRFREDFYETGKPTPADILLLIEVSDRSIGYDRGPRLAAYARAGIPEVWVVSRGERRIAAYTEPAGGAYAVVRYFGAGSSVAPQAFPDIALAVDRIIGGG